MQRAIQPQRPYPSNFCFVSLFQGPASPFAVGAMLQVHLGVCMGSGAVAVAEPYRLDSGRSRTDVGICGVGRTKAVRTDHMALDAQSTSGTDP
jgi:hypothetical protein